MNKVLDPFQLYNIPLDDWINSFLGFIVSHFRPFFQAVSLPISIVLQGSESFLSAIPPLIFIIFVALISWSIANKKTAIYCTISLILIGSIGVWQQAIVSLSLVVTAVAFCLMLGMPIGVLCAESKRVERAIRPMLDIMQTLPSFVYLVPVVMLFGIGEVPGVIATVIFAIPPLIRLTSLGIRQISPEVTEAAIAFGSTPQQLLWEVKIPLAMPTILTGVNQSILMALSMSVVTSMIAVEGLGQMVLQGVGRLDVGLAAVGGLGIVLLAMMLDRLTQAVGPSDR